MLFAEDATGAPSTNRRIVVPSNVTVAKTRDYGKTADEKSGELIFHVGLATFSVVLLMALFLGRREAVVVLVAVPATLALTLFAYYALGYTLNRITLFALIFSIGILVDDAIVVVENIERHFREKQGQPFLRIAVDDQVGVVALGDVDPDGGLLQDLAARRRLQPVDVLGQDLRRLVAARARDRDRNGDPCDRDHNVGLLVVSPFSRIYGCRDAPSHQRNARKSSPDGGENETQYRYKQRAYRIGVFYGIQGNPAK